MATSFVSMYLYCCSLLFCLSNFCPQGFHKNKPAIEPRCPLCYESSSCCVLRLAKKVPNIKQVIEINACVDHTLFWFLFTFILSFGSTQLRQSKWHFYQSNHYLHKTRYGTFIKKIPGQRTKKFRCYQTLNWRRGMSQRFLRMSSFLGILLNVDVDCRFFLVHNSDNNRTSNKKSGFFFIRSQNYFYSNYELNGFQFSVQ